MRARERALSLDVPVVAAHGKKGPDIILMKLQAIMMCNMAFHIRIHVDAELHSVFALRWTG